MIVCWDAQGCDLLCVCANFVPLPPVPPVRASIVREWSFFTAGLSYNLSCQVTTFLPSSGVIFQNVKMLCFSNHLCFLCRAVHGAVQGAVHSGMAEQPMHAKGRACDRRPTSTTSSHRPNACTPSSHSFRPFSLNKHPTHSPSTPAFLPFFFLFAFPLNKIWFSCVLGYLGFHFYPWNKLACNIITSCNFPSPFFFFFLFSVFFISVGFFALPILVFSLFFYYFSSSWSFMSLGLLPCILCRSVLYIPALPSPCHLATGSIISTPLLAAGLTWATNHAV